LRWGILPGFWVDGIIRSGGVHDPRARAAAMPALTRSEMSADSSSAIAPMIVNIALPMGLAVST
jgi:hypothetical protein